MIKINFQNIFETSVTHGVTKDELEKFEAKLPDYLKKIQERGQGFYSVLDDDNQIEEIELFSKEIEGKFTDIVLLGIGGSALGAKTIRDALGEKNCKLHILDNIDPDLIIETSKKLNLNKTLFLVISKSGGTTETLSQYFYFRKKIEEAGLKQKDHFVFVTGNDGFLRETAKKEEIKTFNVPENIGGRFSVLTAVGLLPACLIGVNIRNLVSGAKAMRELFLSEDFGENLPFQIATLQYLLAQEGRTQNVLMPYSTKLKTFTEWFSQLLAESTGKINKEGNNVGITPVPAIGATDQHSQLQLYLEGPEDKLIFFLKIERFKTDQKIFAPEKNEKFSFLKNCTFGKLIQIQQKATADSLKEKGRPSVTFEIAEINEKFLGELFFLFKSSTAFFGEFLEINVFDQPAVDRSKELTKKYLAK